MSLRLLLALAYSSFLESAEPEERQELQAVVEGRVDELNEEKQRERIDNIISIGGELA